MFQIGWIEHSPEEKHRAALATAYQIEKGPFCAKGRGEWDFIADGCSWRWELGDGGSLGSFFVDVDERFVSHRAH